MTLMERRRALMGRKADDGPVYLVQNGVSMPIIAEWSAIGYKRGSARMTSSTTSGAIVFNVASTSGNQADTLTILPKIMPGNKTKLKFDIKCSYQPAHNNVVYYLTAAETVMTANTYAGAFINEKHFSPSSTARVQGEIDISGYKDTGFCCAVTIDRITNSSQAKTLSVYNLWLE